MAKKQKSKSSPARLIVTVSLIALACAIAVVFYAKNTMIPPQPLQQTYSGTMPCADCSGIQTTLTLMRHNPYSNNGTYVSHEIYEGKNVQPYVTEGEWEFSKGAYNKPLATVLTLSNEGGKTYYLVKENNQLQLLDQNKGIIDTPFDETLTLQDKVSSQKKSRQLANPASVNCSKKGGTLKIKTNGDGGQYGLCEFEDNQACEEWAMYRDDCPVGGVKTTGFDNVEQQYCAWLGGQTLAVPDAVCNLPSGNVCKNDALYNGTCQAN